MSVELPILDISQPLNPSSLSSIAKACKEWGFFHITNHGISNRLFTKLFSFSNDFFNLPSQTKLKLGPSSSLKTYTPHFIASPFFESLRVSGPDLFASARSSTCIVFDQKSPEFSEVLQEYGSKMDELSKKIIEILCKSLKTSRNEEDYESEFKNCHGYLRINNYSSLEASQQLEEIEGLGMHTDMSCVTILYQDENGGLQVRSKEGYWFDIKPCEGTLVVNIGDMLQAWSNERLRSSEHRVILQRTGASRFSLAFFWCFEDQKVVFAPNEVVGEGNSRLYDPFVCLDYLKFRESNERGRFEKVGFTVKDFAGIGNLCKISENID